MTYNNTWLLKCRVTLVVIIFTVVVLKKGCAQGIGSLFTQKQTQTKYLLQQIAALKIYIEYARKGYQIAKQGLGTISDIKSGHFSSHKNYFMSLKSINSKIRKSKKVDAAIAMYDETVNGSKDAIKYISSAPRISLDERKFLETAFNNVIRNCDAIMVELLQVALNGEVQMTVAQRMERVERLYSQIQENTNFYRSFNSEVRKVSNQRNMSAGELARIKKWLHNK